MNMDSIVSPPKVHESDALSLSQDFYLLGDKYVKAISYTYAHVITYNLSKIFGHVVDVQIELWPLD